NVDAQPSSIRYTEFALGHLETRRWIFVETFKLADLGASEQLRNSRTEVQLHRFHQLAPCGAADVDADVGRVAHRGDLTRFVVATHFPTLDADRVHAAGFVYAQRVGRRIAALVRRDRRPLLQSHYVTAAHVEALNRITAYT